MKSQVGLLYTNRNGPQTFKMDLMILWFGVMVFNDGSFHHKNNIFTDVGGKAGDALKIMRNPCQMKGAFACGWTYLLRI